MIKAVRTINNMLIVGEVKETIDGVEITDPFAMIPMKEGLKLVPVDIELLGIKMPKLKLSKDKVFYTSEVSAIIAKEYVKLNTAETPGQTQETQGAEESQDTENK